MSDLSVRLEHMGPMRLAAAAVTAESPEDGAIQAVLQWGRAHGQLREGFRFFGFDNCQPHPNHTYTACLTVGPEVVESDDVRIMELPGGLYAMTEVRGVENISPAWEELAAWCERNGYRSGNQQCLEEHPGVLESHSLEDLPLRLYLPLAE